MIQFDVVAMEWALRLTKGEGGQVRSSGTSYNAFSHLSIEDVCIINRQISVVDHHVPSSQWSNSENGTRRKAMCTFIDKKVRCDELLSPELLNIDDMNMILRGILHD